MKNVTIERVFEYIEDLDEKYSSKEVKMTDSEREEKTVYLLIDVLLSTHPETKDFTKEGMEGFLIFELEKEFNIKTDFETIRKALHKRKIFKLRKKINSFYKKLERKHSPSLDYHELNEEAYKRKINNLIKQTNFYYT